MSALCSFCVHHVAVSGEAVNSNLSDHRMLNRNHLSLEMNSFLCYDIYVLKSSKNKEIR